MSTDDFRSQLYTIQHYKCRTFILIISYFVYDYFHYVLNYNTVNMLYVIKSSWGENKERMNKITKQFGLAAKNIKLTRIREVGYQQAM